MQGLRCRLFLPPLPQSLKSQSPSPPRAATQANWRWFLRLYIRVTVLGREKVVQLVLWAIDQKPFLNCSMRFSFK